LTLRHALGSRRPLERLFNRGPLPCGGDTNTIPQAAVNALEPTANPDGIASLRVVMDVGNWEASRFVLPGGQSGNPLSPHYDDQLPLWQRGAGIAIAWTAEGVAQATRERLELVPEGGAAG
jgi:penicillin amidase